MAGRFYGPERVAERAGLCVVQVGERKGHPGVIQQCGSKRELPYTAPQFCRLHFAMFRRRQTLNIPPDAAVAQMAEQPIRNRQVEGSSPSGRATLKGGS
jgi:hypothetical protein